MIEAIHRDTGRKYSGTFAELIGRVVERLQRRKHSQPRLELLERIALAPRQSLALIEAEGRRLLVATSPEGAPAFYSLDGVSLATSTPASPRSSRPSRRVSW